jgi:hypothetical protein
MLSLHAEYYSMPSEVKTGYAASLTCRETSDKADVLILWGQNTSGCDGTDR